MYNSNTRPLALRFLPPKADGNTILAGVNRGLFKNHVVMCTTFSILHGIVDGTLAFVVAELGESLGSWSSFLLYTFFCVSALFLAKPMLYFLGPKQSIQIGSRGLFAYIMTFFVAILLKEAPALRWSVFLVGSCVGGVGAGVLWSGQGTYFTINALRYASLMGLESSTVTAWFASIFATMYLASETIFKALASFVFFATTWDEWLPTTFGLYMVIALVAMEVFRIQGKDLLNSDPDVAEDERGAAAAAVGAAVGGEGETLGAAAVSELDTFSRQLAIAREDALAVARIMTSNMTIRLLLPFQMSFGLSTGLFAFYVNARVVSDHHGSGYIGILSALSTVVACVVAPLSGYFASNEKTYPHSRFVIMVIGGLCYVMQGLAVLSATTAELSDWSTIIFLYIIHGCSRGIWECTNKEEVARAFNNSRDLTAAFAAVYVTSGGTTALGFALYQFFNKAAIGAVNFLVPVLALLSYCYYKLCVEDEGGILYGDKARRRRRRGRGRGGGVDDIEDEDMDIEVNRDSDGGAEEEEEEEDGEEDFSIHSIKSLEAVVVGGSDPYFGGGGGGGGGGTQSMGMGAPGSQDRKKSVMAHFSRGRDRVKQIGERAKYSIECDEDDDEDDEDEAFMNPLVSRSDGHEEEI